MPSAKRFLAEPIKNANYFLALATESDEDSVAEPLAAKTEAKAGAKVEAKVDAKAEVKAEAKADAKVDAKADAEADVKVDAEADVKVDAPPPEKSYREWNSGVRFNTDDMKKNLFSSPFSKSKPHSRTSEKEGWTSIRWNQPQFVDDTVDFIDSMADMEREVEVEVEVDVCAEREIVLEETITPSEDSGTKNITALVWAERIKQSLEKAELAREEKAKKVNPVEFKEALGRLSFFRRPVAQVE